MTGITQGENALEVRESELQHYGIMIEGMLDQGASEDEVVQAVEEARTALPRAA